MSNCVWASLLMSKRLYARVEKGIRRWLGFQGECMWPGPVIHVLGPMLHMSNRIWAPSRDVEPLGLQGECMWPGPVIHGLGPMLHLSNRIWAPSRDVEPLQS